MPFCFSQLYRDRRHRGSFGPDHSPKHSNRNARHTSSNSTGTVSFAVQSPTAGTTRRAPVSVVPLSPTNSRRRSPTANIRSSAQSPPPQQSASRSRSPPNVRSPRHGHTKSVVLSRNAPVSPTHRGTNVPIGSGSSGRKISSRHSTLVRSQTQTTAAFSTANASDSSASASAGAISPLSSPTSKKKKYSSRSLRNALTRQHTAPRLATAEAAQQKAPKREKSKKKQKQKDRRMRLRKTKSYGSKSALQFDSAEPDESDK